MSTSHPVFTSRIDGSAEVIFDLLADMPNYNRWLPGSDAFAATTEVTPYPVRLGTSYRDWGPAGERRGSVTEFDPPKHLAFHHTMPLRHGPLRAEIEVDIRYTLIPVERGTSVIRALDLTIRMRGLQKLARPLVVHAFRKENTRILIELKRYVEAQSK
jgi:uncharacterized protein YndB with AHSA1/START domain